MADDFPYERPKSTTTNTTQMNFDIEAGEKPTTPVDIGSDGGGSTGILDVVFTVDADESGGVDIQDFFKVTLTPVVPDDVNGKPTLRVVITPVGGDAVDQEATTFTAEHSQTMDAWQAEAGRARQA